MCKTGVFLKPSLYRHIYYIFHPSFGTSAALPPRGRGQGPVEKCTTVAGAASSAHFLMA